MLKKPRLQKFSLSMRQVIFSHSGLIFAFQAKSFLTNSISILDKCFCLTKILDPNSNILIENFYRCNRVQPRGGPQIGICNGVQNSRCPGDIRKICIGCPHPHKPELGEGTRGAGPVGAVLCSNGFAANASQGHLTYL